MHDTTTHPARSGLCTAVMAAIAQVPEQIKSDALEQVKRETVRAELSNPPTVKLAHTEQAAKWACIARENGASEEEITAAEEDAHHFIAVFGDDGA